MRVAEPRGVEDVDEEAESPTPYNPALNLAFRRRVIPRSHDHRCPTRWDAQSFQASRRPRRFAARSWIPRRDDSMSLRNVIHVGW